MNGRGTARGFARSVALAGGWLAALAGPLPPAIAAPIEAYGRLPSVDEIALSPDGSRLALVASGAQNRQLQIRNTTDLKLVSVTALGNAKVAGLEWASADHLIIVT